MKISIKKFLTKKDFRLVYLPHSLKIFINILFLNVYFVKSFNFVAVGATLYSYKLYFLFYWKLYRYLLTWFTK